MITDEDIEVNDITEVEVSKCFMCNEEFPVFTLEIHFLTCEKSVSEITNYSENHSSEPLTVEIEETLNGMKNTVGDEKDPSLQFENID